MSCGLAYNKTGYVSRKLDETSYANLANGIPDQIILLGDFNVNPAELSFKQEYLHYKFNNSVHLDKYVNRIDKTVDAIILKPGVDGSVGNRKALFSSRQEAIRHSGIKGKLSNAP